MSTKTIPITKLWSNIDRCLKHNYSAVSYSSYLSRLMPLKAEGNRFTVVAPNPFVAKAVMTDTYKNYIEALLTDQTGTNYILSVETPRANMNFSTPYEIPINKPDYSSAPASKRPTKTREEFLHDLRTEQLLLSSQMDFNYTLDEYLHNNLMTFHNFVVGPNSEFAYEAAQAICDAPAYKYNPLFIHGPSGMGKTHLLHAIGYEIQGPHPDWKILYTTSEKFTNDVISAIKNSSTHIIRDVFRSLDVLLIDDIQFLEKKESTQEEFFNTLNTLKMNMKQIVITADRPLREMPNLMDRLRTRIEGGLMAAIAPPEYETRVAILLQKLEAANHPDIPSEVVNYVAEKIQDNIRELEGAANALSAYSDMGKRLSLETADTIVRHYINNLKQSCINTADIIREVEKYFNLDKNALLSSSRKKALVHARQIAIFLSRELTNQSTPEIGKAFGGRDHSTVLHSIEKVKKDMKDDLSLLNALTALKEKLAE